MHLAKCASSTSTVASFINVRSDCLFLLFCYSVLIDVVETPKRLPILGLPCVYRSTPRENESFGATYPVYSRE